MTEESLHPLAVGAAILWPGTERNATPLQPQFLRPIVGELGSRACPVATSPAASAARQR